MTIVLAIGFCIETAVIIWIARKANENENDIFKMDFQLYELRKKINGKEEAVEVLSESVRKLNGVVKDLEQKQPKIEPKNRMNTRAFIAGWDADEPEPLQLLLPKEEVMKLLDAMKCQKIEPLPPPQWSQLTFYPWQQTPSGAILPLRYINRRLEDM